MSDGERLYLPGKKKKYGITKGKVPCMWDAFLEFDRCIALMAKDHKSIAESGRYRQKIIKSEKKLP